MCECGGLIQFIGKRAKLYDAECSNCREVVVFSAGSKLERALNGEDF